MNLADILVKTIQKALPDSNSTATLAANAIIPSTIQYDVPGINGISLGSASTSAESIDTTTEPMLAKYISSGPNFLFTSEYVINGEFKGILVAFQKYSSSTHYEIWKKNHFSADGNFERVLFLGVSDLITETKNFLPYLTDVLGMKDLPTDLILILDDQVKQDRIYSYKIKGKRVPSAASDIDYDFILDQQKSLNKVPVSSGNNTIFDAAFIHLGNADYAWILALTNDDLMYFGKGAQSKVSDLLPKSGINSVLNVPKDLNILLTIISQGIGLFGAETTFNALLTKLKGLPEVFHNTFQDAFDQQRQAFSYDKFTTGVKENFPYIDLILQLATVRGTDSLTLTDFSGNSGKTFITIVAPDKKGDESISSLASLTSVLKFINNSVLAAIYVQDAQNVQNLLNSTSGTK